MALILRTHPAPLFALNVYGTVNVYVCLYLLFHPSATHSSHFFAARGTAGSVGASSERGAAGRHGGAAATATRQDQLRLTLNPDPQWTTFRRASSKVEPRQQDSVATRIVCPCRALIEDFTLHGQKPHIHPAGGEQLPGKRPRETAET